MQVPEEVLAQTIGGWESAFFNSEFTHPRRRATDQPSRRHFSLWSSLANNDIPFPVKYLTDAKQMLREFIEGNEER